MSVYLTLCFCKNKILATDVHIMMILNKNSYSMVELSAVLQREVISHSPVSYESQSRGFKKQNIPLCREVKISHFSLTDESGSRRGAVSAGWMGFGDVCGVWGLFCCGEEFGTHFYTSWVFFLLF